MPIGDDLHQALRDGRMGPDSVVLMNPADFDRLRRDLTVFHESPDGTTIFGTQIVSTPLQERGSVRIVQRSTLTPPRMVIRPENLTAVLDEVYRGLREPTFVVPSGTFQHPIIIPASECGEGPLVKKAPPPKSLWQRLEEDE